MQDKIKTSAMLGDAVRRLRQERGLKATDIAKRSGRSRDVLHRLEGGQDVSVSSLLDILRAAGCALQIVPAGLPTMEQMRQRFAQDDDQGADDAA